MSYLEAFEILTKVVLQTFSYNILYVYTIQVNLLSVGHCFDLEEEHKNNHLVHCPNCAAEFQHVCQTGQDERAKLILDLDPAVDEAKLIVHIDMPVHRQLRFTQRHLIDLQVAVQNWRKANPECVK